MAAKRKITTGLIYSAKCGGKYMAVRIKKSCGHGRYEATVLPSGQDVRVTSAAIKGVGETLEQWEARQRPREQEATAMATPTTASSTSGRPRPGRTKKKIVSLAEYEATVNATANADDTSDGTQQDAALDAVVAAAETGNLAKGISIPMPPKKKRASGLDAAVMVLREAGTPLNCGEIVKRMLEKKLWQTNGRTPSATIYASILVEIQRKGDASRFRKTDRGMFALTTVGEQAAQ